MVRKKRKCKWKKVWNSNNGGYGRKKKEESKKDDEEKMKRGRKILALLVPFYWVAEST